MNRLPGKWGVLVFNLQERWHHTMLSGELEILRKNELLSHLSDDDFQKILSNIRLIKYSSNVSIIKEGEVGDACYIIYEGEVGVFIRTVDGQKIQQVTLKRGDFFGEQSILGDIVITRNADVVAMKPTTLICIDKDTFKTILDKNTKLRNSLIKRSYQQACENLSTSTGFFSDIKELLPNVPDAPVIEFKKDDLIFEIGDRSDYVYFILKGEVELVQQKFSEDSPVIVLHPGLLFGEGGVLGYNGDFRNQRAISALARSDVRLLAVPGPDFKKAMIGNMQLKLFLSKLHKGYSIPMQGHTEQYFTNVPELGPAITTFYQLTDGRSVFSRLYILNDLFMMIQDNAPKAKKYVYQNEILKLEIDVVDKHLVGIRINGMCDELPTLCSLLIKNEPVDRATFARLEIIGRSIAE